MEVFDLDCAFGSLLSVHGPTGFAFGLDREGIGAIEIQKAPFPKAHKSIQEQADDVEDPPPESFLDDDNVEVAVVQVAVFVEGDASDAD